MRVSLVLGSCLWLSAACSDSGQGVTEGTDSGPDAELARDAEASSPVDASAPSDAADTPDGAATRGDASFPVPGLPEGTHLAVFDGYEEPSAGARAAVLAARQALRSAGADVARVHVSFRELSPTPDEVDLTPLVSAIAALDVPYVAALIETIDSDGFSESMPSDLVGSDAYHLRTGLTLDSAEVTERFARVLTALAQTPEMKKVVVLSVGNEPDAYFDDVSEDSAEGRAYTQSLLGFTAAARRAVRAAGADTGVAMTLRTALLTRAPATLGTLLTGADVAVFNYYGQGPDLGILPSSEVSNTLDALARVAGARPVVLQEVGCPAGRSGGTIGSSDAAQSAFFSALVAGLSTRPQFRIGLVFQLVDWSPGLATSYGDAYGSAGFPELGAKVNESLSSMGLVHYDDGRERPAFAVIRAGIAALAR